MTRTCLVWVRISLASGHDYRIVINIILCENFARGVQALISSEIRRLGLPISSANSCLTNNRERRMVYVCLLSPQAQHFHFFLQAGRL